MLIVKRYVKITLSFLSCLWVIACGSESNVPGPIAGEVYVIVPAGKAPFFTTYLGSLVAKYGMVPNLGGATDDKGYSLYVLDATSPSVRLRSENVLLDGNEESKLCGVYTEPHSDPGQYFISVSPNTQKSDSRESRELLTKIVKDLKIDGYDVRPKPMICSPLSKIESKG
jgi:hypothetical protein